MTKEIIKEVDRRRERMRMMEKRGIKKGRNFV